MNFPPSETEPLLALLREELQQYGVLLRLLEGGRFQSSRAYGDHPPALSEEIEENFSVLAALRQQRQEQIELLTGKKPSRSNGCTISLESLLPFFPMMVAPMVCGLVEEVNGLNARLARLRS